MPALEQGWDDWTLGNSPAPPSYPPTAWPIGSIFVSIDPTNPATLLGFGAWTAFGSGRVMVGVDSGDTDFDTVEETGGAKAVAAAGSVAAPTLSGNTADETGHTHPYTDVPMHVHGFVDLRGSTSGVDLTGYGTISASADSSSTATPLATGNPLTGVGTGHTSPGDAHHHGVGSLAASAPGFTGSATSVVQPYITVHMWKRTA